MPWCRNNAMGHPTRKIVLRRKARLRALLAGTLVSLVAFPSCGGAPEAPAGSGQKEGETTTSEKPENEDDGGPGKEMARVLETARPRQAPR